MHPFGCILSGVWTEVNVFKVLSLETRIWLVLKGEAISSAGFRVPKCFHFWFQGFGVCKQGTRHHQVLGAKL